MRTFKWVISGAVAVLAIGAQAGDGEWNVLNARYLIHSQTVTYPATATKVDRVFTVVIDGRAAKELFELNGPDVREVCGGEKGDRARRKKGVDCVYSAQDVKSKNGPYRCWIGLNLRTGDGDVRVSC